jgi:pimeloyl-ACP methyl ester carboxylesterase
MCWTFIVESGLTKSEEVAMKIYKNKKYEQQIIQTYDNLLKHWGIEVEEREVSTRYGNTHIIEAGKANTIPVLLFHGVGDDSAIMWLYNAKAWADKFHIYAIDTIGGPGKSRPNSNYNKEFQDVLWIDDIIEQFGVTQINIVGVSHGGYLAQLYKVNRPERVHKIINLASSVPAGVNGNPLKTMLRIFLPEALFPTRNNIIKLLRKLAGDNHQVFTENPYILEHYTCLLKGFRTMSMGCHKVSCFPEEQIKLLKKDTYYLVGEEDPFEKMGGKDALLHNHMNARFYPRVGHGINHEIAEEINQTVISLLTEEA